MYDKNSKGTSHESRWRRTLSLIVNLKFEYIKDVFFFINLQSTALCSYSGKTFWFLNADMGIRIRSRGVELFIKLNREMWSDMIVMTILFIVIGHIFELVNFYRIYSKTYVFLGNHYWLLSLHWFFMNLIKKISKL